MGFHQREGVLSREKTCLPLGSPHTHKIVSPAKIIMFIYLCSNVFRGLQVPPLNLTSDSCTFAVLHLSPEFSSSQVTACLEFAQLPQGVLVADVHAFSLQPCRIYQRHIDRMLNSIVLVESNRCTRLLVSHKLQSESVP